MVFATISLLMSKCTTSLTRLGEMAVSYTHLDVYKRQDFDLSNLGAGTYVVKVHNTYTNKVVSGLVVIQH